MVSHDTIEQYIRLNFALQTHYYYNIGDLENMMPWEREAYILLMLDWIEREKERRRFEEASR